MVMKIVFGKLINPLNLNNICNLNRQHVVPWSIESKNKKENDQGEEEKGENERLSLRNLQGEWYNVERYWSVRKEYSMDC